MYFYDNLRIRDFFFTLRPPVEVILTGRNAYTYVC